MDIAKLVAKLELQSSQFQSELEKTNRKLLGFQSTSSKALSGIERQAKAFGRALAGMFAGLTLAGGIAAVKQAIQLGDEIGKAATKAGIGTNAMSELAFAARMADVDIGNLSNSIKFMQIALSKANTGGKEQLEVLQALGLEVSGLRRLGADKQFEAIADAINSLRDPADKARASVALFGKAGADLLPLFSQGADGIRKAREEAKKFGQSFDEDVIKTLQKGDDAIKKLGVTWDTFWAKIAVGTVGIAEAFDVIDKDILGELKDRLTIAEKALRDASAPPDGGTFDKKIYLEAAAAVDILRRQIVNLELYTHGSRVRRGRGSPAAPGFGATVAAVQADAFTPEMREAIRAAERWQALVNETDKGIAAGIIETNDAIGDSFHDLQEPILKTTDSMTVFSEQAARNMQDAFADFLFDPFEDGLRGMLKGFVDILRRMAAEAASAQIFEKLGGIEGIGSFFSSFFTGSSASTGGDALSQMFSLYGGPKAGGGPLQSGKWHIAGEHGPEPIWGGGPGAFAMGYGGMGGVTITNNIDARGATQDAIKALPEVLKRNNEALEARIVQRLSSGRYRG
jgi:hypothetical protein